MMAGDGVIAQSEQKESLFESFMKTVGTTKVGSLFLGFLMTLLVLLSELASETTTVETLLICIFVLMAAFLFAIFFQKDKHPGFGSWGVIGLFFLGAALGVLAYHARGGVADQWTQYKRLGGLSDVIFVGLFVFGLIMAVFVVRVWNKGQDDFMKSVATALGGAAIPPLLGKTIAVDGSKAFAAYFLGFAVSAAVNVIYCARLLANYSNKRSLESRAVLSFLYGPDKAEAVDTQFLRNFEEDPVYARRLLINAVLEYQKRVRREFAVKKEHRRKNQGPTSPPGPGPLSYYQLLSIECDKDTDLAVGSPPGGSASPLTESLEGSQPEKLYNAVFREITDENPINEDMFRIAVSLKWQENLEYIGAPGAYQKSFSYFSSVAGLALFVRQTIVMDRDKNKRFRTTQYPEGLCPAKIEQPRGLDEIDFLSYLVVPVVSSIGQAEETALGILHIDTRVFAIEAGSSASRSFEFAENIGDPAQKVYRAKLRRSDLTEFANNLYDRDDQGVKYLEEMRAVLVPILHLYLKCRQGST